MTYVSRIAQAQEEDLRTLANTCMVYHDAREDPELKGRLPEARKTLLEGAKRVLDNPRGELTNTLNVILSEDAAPVIIRDVEQHMGQGLSKGQAYRESIRYLCGEEMAATRNKLIVAVSQFDAYVLKNPGEANSVKAEILEQGIRKEGFRHNSKIITLLQQELTLEKAKARQTGKDTLEKIEEPSPQRQAVDAKLKWNLEAGMNGIKPEEVQALLSLAREYDGHILRLLRQGLVSPEGTVVYPPDAEKATALENQMQDFIARAGDAVRPPTEKQQTESDKLWRRAAQTPFNPKSAIRRLKEEGEIR